MKVRLENVRLSFPQLFEPKSINNSDPKFSASFLYEPESQAHKAMKKAMAVVAKEKWGEKAEEVYKQLKAKDRIAVHDAATKSDYAGYEEGLLFTNASTSVAPTVVDKDRTRLTVAAGRPYSGCYVNAVVDVWAQDNQYGKRINASLGGVQFVADGERLAGGISVSEDDFEALGDAEEETTDEELFD